VKKLGWKGPWYMVSAVNGEGTRELCFAIMEFLEANRRA
jgi:GTP-binding protein